MKSARNGAFIILCKHLDHYFVLAHANQTYIITKISFGKTHERSIFIYDDCRSVPSHIGHPLF